MTGLGLPTHLRELANEQHEGSEIEVAMRHAANEIERLREALQTIRGLCELFPGGYDLDDDPNDTSPADANVHTTGLIVRACVEALG